MENSYDYREFAILYVDDEEKSLKYFEKVLSSQFRILTASSAADGVKILNAEHNHIGIVLSDQRMPGETGVQLIERVRQLNPRILRILVTAYSDFDAAIRAVNSGAIYKYVSKPWETEVLELTLRRSMEFFLVQKERDDLLREKLSMLYEMTMMDRVMSMGIMAAGLSHHIRNSLVAVRTFMDLAPAKLHEENIDRQKLRNPAFWNDFYGQVQDQIRRILGLISDLGMASEVANSSYQDRVKLGLLIEELIGFYSGKFALQNIQVENRISHALPELIVDYPKFKRIFELLLCDELASLPSGSQIILDAELILDCKERKNHIRVVLQDDGPGLSENSLRALFNPFFLRKDDPQEYGINLMTCYFLVYHHGGKISVEKRDGGGMVFTILFPIEPPFNQNRSDEADFFAKTMANERLWQELQSGSIPDSY